MSLESRSDLRPAQRLDLLAEAFGTGQAALPLPERERSLELAEQLAALARVLHDADRAGVESEAEWALAWALWDEPS